MKKGIQMPDGQRLKLPSPNLADNVMMRYDKAAIINHAKVQVRMPQPLRTMGRR